MLSQLCEHVEHPESEENFFLLRVVLQGRLETISLVLEASYRKTLLTRGHACQLCEFPFLQERFHGVLRHFHDAHIDIAAFFVRLQLKELLEHAQADRVVLCIQAFPFLFLLRLLVILVNLTFFRV